MEVWYYHHTKTPDPCSSLPLLKSISKSKHPYPILCASPGWNVELPGTGLSFKTGKWGLNSGLAASCASWGPGSVAETERELEAEINQDNKEEWMALMGWLSHKCGEEKGVVELLECLEREAIMGEDEGREPTDYNRRAQIFDKSSRVFQALKERDASSRKGT